MEYWSLNESKVGVTDKLAEQPDEGLFELVVRFGRDIVVLEVLLSVESDLLGLNLSVLNVNLVSDQNNGDVLADTDEILVPFGNISIGDTGAHIEHNDGAISANATYNIVVNIWNFK